LTSTSIFPGSELDKVVKKEFPDVFGKDELKYWPCSIIVYAQWVPFSPNDKPDDDWFKVNAKGNSLGAEVKIKPMSELTAQWIFNPSYQFHHLDQR